MPNLKTAMKECHLHLKLHLPSPSAAKKTAEAAPQHKYILGSDDHPIQPVCKFEKLFEAHPEGQKILEDVLVQVRL